MKKILILLIYLTSLITIAEEDLAISANISIANNYIWRGMSQHNEESGDDDEITISGGFDYNFDNGFAVGIWGSNVSVKKDTYDASIEIDLYGSYSGSYKKIDYELGYIDYKYPNASDLDFQEAYISASYNNLTLVFYQGIDDAENNIELSYKINLAEIDTTITYGDYDNSNKYQSIAATKSFNGIDYTLALHRNDPDNSSLSSENNVVFSISKSF